MVLLTAAIEIGADLSGYAFSLKHELFRDPSKIHIKKWESTDGVREKIPTSLLLTPQQKFAGFGYDAKYMYMSLSDNSQLRGCYYFQHFGHILYDSCGLTKRTMLKDADGRMLPAITILSKFIKCLKNDLLKEVTRRLGDLIPTSLIFWVLTIPASCGDKAKQFMREAAINAGINEKQVLIVPKAVAVLNVCRCLFDSRDDAGNKGSEDLQYGRRCLILDAGGERTDSTLLEMLMCDKVRVLSNESMTEGRSSLADEAFLSFIAGIVGHDVMNRFSKKCPEDYQNLLRKIQRTKNYFMGEESGNITIKFPLSMQELFERKSGKSFRDAVKQSMYHDKMSCLFDKWRISNDLMKHLFDPPISAIVSYLTVLFQNPKIKETDIIVLAGVFSESPMLQMAVSTAFTTKKVIIAQNQGEVALKGAILYTLKADIVENNGTFSPCIDSHCEFDTTFNKNDANITNDSHMEHDNMFSQNAQEGETQIVNEEQVEEFKNSEDCHQVQTIGMITTGQNHYSLDPFSLEDLNRTIKEIKSSLEDMKEDVRSIKENVEKQSKSTIEEISIKWNADGVKNLNPFDDGCVRPRVLQASQGGEANTGPVGTRHGRSEETGTFAIHFHALIDVVSARIFKRFFRTLVYISAEENDQNVPDVEVWIDKKEHDYRQSSEAFYQLLREWLRWHGQLDVKTYMNLITKTMLECGLKEENEKYTERIKSRLKKKH